VMGLHLGAHFLLLILKIMCHTSGLFQLAVFQPKLGRKPDTRHQLRLMSDIKH